LNFELEIHIVWFILKILKKYHENQRKKLILTRYVLNKSKFHAKTLPYWAKLTLRWHVTVRDKEIGYSM
jgi:hypothetical protein